MRRIDGPALAYLLNIPQGTIHSWATRGHIKRAGHDRRGRTLYDLDHALDYAQQRGIHPQLSDTPTTQDDVLA